MKAFDTSDQSSSVSAFPGTYDTLLMGFIPFFPSSGQETQEDVGAQFSPEAAGPLDPNTIPCPAWAGLALLGRQTRVLLRFPSAAMLTTGAGVLLPKIEPGRKEVARPNSRCEQKC